MKTTRRFHLLALFSFLLTATSLQAEEPDLYRIEFMNCKRIQVGEKWFRIHDVFDGKDTVRWKNGRQFMRVRNVKTQKEYALTLDGFEAAKVQTLHDFLIKTNSVSTRGFVGTRHYSQVVHYLVDSLHFQAFDDPQPDVVTEVVWKRLNGREQVTRIQRTSDNSYYIVTRAILGRGTPPDSLLLDIRERSIKEGWVNRVYHQIPVRCLPPKMK